ncbi:MAG: zf-TFIIB domain-containing protein [Planctomycetes bacterium]|nr:zf-TFIIB domain-containing protein [Planctomycetota bacterium]
MPTKPVRKKAVLKKHPALAPHENSQIKPEGERPCPICGAVMESNIVKGVNVDLCAEHGVWLDNGELESIVRKIKGYEKRRASSAAKKAKSEGKRDALALGWLSLLFE